MVVAETQGYHQTSRAVWGAIIGFLILAVGISEALAFLFVLGRLSSLELAVTIFTVLALAGGLIYTVIWIAQPHGIDSR